MNLSSGRSLQVRVEILGPGEEFKSLMLEIPSDIRTNPFDNF